MSGETFFWLANAILFGLIGGYFTLRFLFSDVPYKAVPLWIVSSIWCLFCIAKLMGGF